MNIDKFNQEHASLLASVTTLRELVHAGVAANAEPIVRQLVAMSALVKLYLAAEDRVLYPALAGAADPRVARVGQQFQQEMGGIAASYGAFVSRWNLPARLAGDPQCFRDEANAVFKALHQRIQREGHELYPLAAQVRGGRALRRRPSPVPPRRRPGNRRGGCRAGRERCG